MAETMRYSVRPSAGADGLTGCMFGESGAVGRNPCLHELFARQADRAPQAAAVCLDEGVLRYGELNRAADALADRLRALGVGPDVGVGVCFERSLELVVAVMGVLKAGGAYLPLDPAYPPERLGLMLRDSEVPVLLAGRHLARTLPYRPAHVLSVDELTAAGTGSRAAVAGRAARPENLAYVIYTSGSTGMPKGVLLTHAGVTNLLADFDERCPVYAGDRCSLWTSMSFDVSVYELFSALTAGAELHVVPDVVRAHGPRFLAWLRDQRITSAYVPPGMIRDLLRAVEREPSGWALRRLLVGVEPIPASLLRAISERLPNLTIINGYGPTETTICSTLYSVGADIGQYRNTPIGEPVRNTAVYLLDEVLEPAPAGATGEMFIGGAGVARGYLHRPALTAERFIPDPFSGLPGARMYRTGDHARRLPNGLFEFAGRRDQQVKIRGVRIELGEIERALSSLPLVEAGVVVAREDSPGEKQLVAYVIPKRGPGAEEVQEADLRRALRQLLPDFMVPSRFMLLDALPMTLNDKVDRRALPPPGSVSSGAEIRQAAPRTALERELASIWAEAIGRPTVSVEDDFFALGGHSLLATHIAARIRERLNIEAAPGLLFEHPTIASLAEALARPDSVWAATDPLTRWESEDSAPPDSERGEPSAYPLTFTQQRFWLLDRLEPNSALHNIALMFAIEGAVDVAALRRALDQVVSRHQALRVTFEEGQGEPVQQVAGQQPIPWELRDVRSLAERERAASVQEQVEAHARIPLDLRHGPLLRCLLIRTADDGYTFVLTVHHIAFDGWSLQLLLQELGACYEAEIEGRPASLRDLPLAYPEVARWERQSDGGEARDRLLAYWRAQLSPPPPALQLPLDHPRPVEQGHRGARVAIPLAPTLVEQLAALGGRAEASQFMILTAAFGTLMYRYAGQSDVVIGIPVANRMLPEFEQLIGPFVNTLPLRLDLSGHPTFAEMLRRVRSVALGAYAHQSLPFEHLLQALNVERTPSHSPLFQVMFSVQNAGLPVVERAGMRLSYVSEVDTATAKYDITVIVELGGKTPLLIAEYNTDLFERGTIERLLDRFRRLLEAVIDSPERSITSFPLLDPAERQVLLTQWSRAERGSADRGCFHYLVEARAERTPADTAVTFAGERLTYGELNRKANQLASYLRGQGVGPNSLVGVSLERSPDLVVAFLGVLKSGAAYVPVDPAYPPERRAFMLEDADVAAIITQEALATELPEQGAAVVLLDSDWPAISRASGANPAGEIHPDQLAYVIYTSGSTGRPKGVVIPHRGLWNFAQSVIEVFQLGREDRVLQFSSMSFDASIFDLVLAFSAGAALHTAQRAALLPGPDLARVLRDEAISAVLIPPSSLAALGQPELPALGTLIAGGEACSGELVNRWGRGRRFFNAYGPTEASIWATVAECVPGGGKPPIGRPVMNAEVYLLDEHLEPVPIGLPGEIYIGGAGLAHGYRNRPALTAASFVPHPFSREPGARLYRTGDLGRYRPDGSLDYLGRRDQQVKLRGYRIEPGEIEATLAAHPGVREVAVVVRGAPGAASDEEKRLVAYVVPQQEGVLTVRDLHAAAASRLPHYMVPSAIVLLDALPVSPNGKLDYQALPEPGRESVATADTFVGPRTALEELLSRLWGQMLGREQLGIDDNFFALGGHSLLATRILARVRDIFHIEVSPSAFFSAPTIAGLAGQLAARETKPGLNERIAQVANRIEGDLFR